ncbi:MAG: ATP-dependent Clp protease adaptor ClpS [Pseudomonadota bacterium]
MPKSPDQRTQREDGVDVKERTRTRPPRRYEVLLHNDDYTTMEFVVLVLVTVFRRDHTAAVRIMLSVHREGVGVAGVYTREVAEEKLQRAMTMARENGMPLQLSMQPER